jgi:hypothetical protein
VSRARSSLWRVSAAAILLLGVLAASLVLVGQPSSAGTGPLTLPHPVPLSAIRSDGPALKVLLVGDSMAGSLGVGMEALAPGYHVVLANAGHPGCSLSMDGDVLLTLGTWAAPGQPCVKDQPGALLAAWRSYVDAFRPDVVIYLARSDLLDQQVQGTTTWLGHRDFNRWLDARLRAGIAVLGSRGARVVLMTTPVSEEPTLVAQASDNPVRVARDGGLLRLVAASSHGTVSVYDLAALLTPGFRYREAADGLPLRCADGVHLTPEAGIVVAADLFPRLWALAAHHRVAGGGRWVDGPVPTTTPPWYARLPCG